MQVFLESFEQLYTKDFFVKDDQRTQMTGYPLNLFMENIQIGVKSKQFLPNPPDGRGHREREGGLMFMCV